MNHLPQMHATNADVVHAFHGGVYYIVSDNLQFMTTVYDNPRDKVGKLGLKYAVYSQDATGYHSSKPYCSVAEDEDDKKTLDLMPRDEGEREDVEMANANHNDSSVARLRRDRALKKKSVRTFFRVWFWHPVLARDSTLSTEMRMREGGGAMGTRRVLASFAELAAEWGLQVEQIQNQNAANPQGAETESEKIPPLIEVVEHSSLADVLSSEAEVEAATSTTSDIRSREPFKLSALVSERDLEKCNTDPIADRPLDGCPLLFCRDWLLSGQVFEDHTGCQEMGKKKGASHVTYTKHLEEFRDEVLLSSTPDGRPAGALGRRDEEDDVVQKEARLRQLLFYTAGDLPMGVLNTVRGTCHLRGGSKAGGKLGDSSSALDLFAFPHRGVHTRFLRYANSDEKESRTTTATGGRNYSGEEEIANFLHAIQSNDYELGERLENTDVITEAEIEEAMQVLRQAGLGGVGGGHDTAAAFAAQLGVPLLELGRLRTASTSSSAQEVNKDSDEERAFAVLKSFTSPITDMNFVTEQECSQKCHEYNQNLLPLWVHMFVGGNSDHLIPLLASKFGDFPAALNPRFCSAYTFVAVSHGGDFGAFYTPAVSAARLEGRCVAKVNNWDKDLQAARHQPTAPPSEDDFSEAASQSTSGEGATNKSRKKIWSKTRTISSEVGNVLTPTVLAGTTAAAQALLRTDREPRDCPGPQQAIELRVVEQNITLSKLTIRPWSYSRYLAEQDQFLSASDRSSRKKENAHASSSRRLQKLKLFVDGRDVLRTGECSVVTNALYRYDERLAAASYDLYATYADLVLECRSGTRTTRIEEAIKIEAAVEGHWLWLCGVAVFGSGSGDGSTSPAAGAGGRGGAGG
eukprot:g4782.t1